MKKTLTLSLLTLAALGMTAAPVFAETTPAVSAIVTAAPYRFMANLAAGSTGDGVRQLQMILNASDATAVAQIPRAGSKGHETSSFGPATVAAVKRFQKVHGIEATGFVGPLTRAALNEALAAAQPSIPTAVSITADMSVPGSATVTAKYDGGGQKPTVWFMYGATPQSMTLRSSEAVSGSVIGSTSVTISNLGTGSCWAQAYVKTSLGTSTSDAVRCAN